MKKVACLITWPVHRDYPIFRYKMRKMHLWFQDVFVAFTNENQPTNYSRWILENMSYVQSTKPFYDKEDWRNDTVNALLTLNTTADYYLFMEQDFLIRDESFLKTILSSDEPFIYYKEGERIHPAFALVSREIVNKTSKDFSAYPDQGKDHFGRFFDEVTALTPGKDIREFKVEDEKGYFNNIKEKVDFYHMGGCSQNYSCAEAGEPLYKPDEFTQYNYLSMLLPYQNPYFYRKELEVADKYGFSEKKSFLNKFFPIEGETK